MSGRSHDLPPGLQWLAVLDTQWDDTGLWVIGALLVLSGNVALLLWGAWIERCHDRRLVAMATATAAVRVFAGCPPPDARGVPQLVQAAIVMAPAPLGRLALLVRRIIGGRVVTRQRDLQRIRRLALLRLREQALRVGAGVVAGVEFCPIAMGRGRFAVLATGTALVGSDGASQPATTEAVGAEPTRPRREVLLALIGVVVATLAAVALSYLSDAIFGDLWQNWVLHIKR